jgi:hypothetical protein
MNGRARAVMVLGLAHRAARVGTRALQQQVQTRRVLARHRHAQRTGVSAGGIGEGQVRVERGLMAARRGQQYAAFAIDLLVQREGRRAAAGGAGSSARLSGKAALSR